MLTQLQHTLNEYKASTGLFITAYDPERFVLFSQGSLNKPAINILHTIYESYIKKTPNIQSITLHIVTEIHTSTPEELKNINLNTYGISIHDEDGNTGVVLPKTAGINTIRQAFKALKAKAQLHGKSHIHMFQTTNITLTHT